MKETALGLLIPESTDPPDGPTQIGDNAEKADALLQRAGAHAKKCEVAAEQSRENAAYGLLGTPDECPDITIAKGDLIHVAYRAQVKNNDERPGLAAIFIDSLQLKVSDDAGAPQLQECYPIEGLSFMMLGTTHYGLDIIPGATSDVTTGQALTGGGVLTGTGVKGTVYSGLCTIFGLAAGTYDISVRYRGEAGGKVTAKNRTLWVWRQGFA